MYDGGTTMRKHLKLWIALMIAGLYFTPQIVHATPLSQEVKDRIALYPSYYAEDYTNVEKLYRFLLPVSDQRKLKESDLDHFSPFELTLAAMKSTRGRAMFLRTNDSELL
jgi:hypothetical protein